MSVMEGLGRGRKASSTGWTLHGPLESFAFGKAWCIACVCWGETWRVLAGATRYTYQLTRMALARLGPNGTAVDERGVAGAAAIGRRELGYDVLHDCGAKTRRPKVEYY